jgi:hypothetical protein
MSVRDRLLMILVLVVTPAEPLHEWTHMLFALPFAQVSYERREDRGAYASLEWSSDAPLIWIRVSHLAPTIVGTIAVVVSLPALPWMLWTVERIGAQLAMWLGVPVLVEELRALVALFLLMNWLMYLCPSSSDLRPFQDA